MLQQILFLGIDTFNKKTSFSLMLKSFEMSDQLLVMIYIHFDEI